MRLMRESTQTRSRHKGKYGGETRSYSLHIQARLHHTHNHWRERRIGSRTKNTKISASSVGARVFSSNLIRKIPIVTELSNKFKLIVVALGRQLFGRSEGCWFETDLLTSPGSIQLLFQVLLHDRRHVSPLAALRLQPLSLRPLQLTPWSPALGTSSGPTRAG